MSDTEPSIPWPQLTKFIGQLNHDLRNHLNAVELQAAFLHEIVEGDEAKAEIKRLRGMTGEMGIHLQKLSSALGRIQPHPMRYVASEFVEDLQAKVAVMSPEQTIAVEWQNSLGTETVTVDPQLLQEAFLELLGNAQRHGGEKSTLVFAARPLDNAIEFTLREPKENFTEETANWGARPLAKIGYGHYGLGLHRARSIFEAHHGSFCAHFDPATSTLVTTVSLPVVA